MKKYYKTIITYFVVFLLILTGFILANYLFPQKTQENYIYSDLVKSIEAGLVTHVQISRDANITDTGVAKARFVNGREQTLQIPSMISFMQLINKYSVIHDFAVDATPAPKTGMFMQLLSPLLMLLVSVCILLFVAQKIQGGGGGKLLSFGSSKAKTAQDKDKINFNSVAGLQEEKVELQEIVEFLKQPKKFIDIGARIPRGVLLIGPPGTGKTLLAKAVAGEAGVPFFSMSGSDFVEMFVGVGASRVRDLFEQAKKNSPCIIFIDEIDAVARRRGAGLGGGHDEREQTLNQLLVEMDGFAATQSVIVIAATNRPDILDPAILRPGRFDRQVVVGRPDVKGREEILKVHAKGKLMSEDVDLKVVAQTTPGFTGADLENLLNESALLAARVNKKRITMEELRRAFVKVGIGTEKKSHVISDKEKRITAYHEAGHAILFEKLSELDQVHIISIIPTGLAGGYTMPLPAEEKHYVSKLSMLQEIISLLGGLAAEILILKDTTTGASSDIKRATNIARNMVTKYGMSDKLGPIKLGDDNEEVFLGRDFGHVRNYSEQIAREIDEEIRAIIKNAFEEAKRIILENIEVLHKAAELLIQKEKITGEEFRELFA